MKNLGEKFKVATRRPKWFTGLLGTLTCYEDRIKKWVEIVAIVLAGTWAIVTYANSEYWKPKAAPVNISLDLSLKKITPDKDYSQNSLVGIEMRVSATNPTTKEIKLLPTLYDVRGINIIPQDLNQEGFDNYVKILNYASPQLGINHEVQELGKHYIRHEDTTPESFGRLFADDNLKPNEKVSRTLVFYVPKNKYDKIHVNVQIPTAVHPEKLLLIWKWNDETKMFDYKILQQLNFFQKLLSNKETLLPDDWQCLNCKGQKTLESIMNDHQLQFSFAQADLSLWGSSENGGDR